MTDTSDPEQVKREKEIDEKSAMRAYLQRAEVRLSTMHRVAGIFLNGAGLLILLPLIFTSNTFAKIFTSLIKISDISVIFLLIPLVIALGLPVYALILLLQDIIQFYFTKSHPGLAFDKVFYPRFVLSGIALPKDEVSDNKQRILEGQLNHKMINFILPRPRDKKEVYDEIKEHTKGEIIPFTRRMPSNCPVCENLSNTNSNPKETSLLTPSLMEKIKDNNKADFDELKSDIDLFHVMFGLAGVVDRDLSEEVAKMEASLVRHQILLRRLILRYMKAFLLLIWTTLVLGIAATCLDVDFLTNLDILLNLSAPITVFSIYAIAFLIWAIFTPKIVKLPVEWIYGLTNPAESKKESIQRDSELVHFENRVIYGVIISFIVTTLAISYELSNVFHFDSLNIVSCFIISILISIFFGYWNLKDQINNNKFHS